MLFLLILTLFFGLLRALEPLAYLYIAYAAVKAANEYVARGHYERDKELVNAKPSFLVRIKRAYRAFHSTA